MDTNSQSPKTAGFYAYSLYVNDDGKAVTIDPMIVKPAYAASTLRATARRETSAAPTRAR